MQVMGKGEELKAINELGDVRYIYLLSQDRQECYQTIEREVGYR